MQTLNDIGYFIFFDYEGQVDRRSSLRNHANLLICQFAKYQRGDARLIPQILAHEADDCLASFIFYVSQLGQVGREGGYGVIRVHGQGDADFRCRNHIHCHFVPVKGFKDRAQKTVGQQHAGRSDLDDRDMFLGRDGFEDVLSLGSVRSDTRSFAGRI